MKKFLLALVLALTVSQTNAAKFEYAELSFFGTANFTYGLTIGANYYEGIGTNVCVKAKLTCSGMSMTHIMNALGQQEWELVISTPNQKRGTSFIFKRAVK